MTVLLTYRPGRKKGNTGGALTLCHSLHLGALFCSNLTNHLWEISSLFYRWEHRSSLGSRGFTLVMINSSSWCWHIVLLMYFLSATLGWALSLGRKALPGGPQCYERPREGGQLAESHTASYSGTGIQTQKLKHWRTHSIRVRLSQKLSRIVVSGCEKDRASWNGKASQCQWQETQGRK